MKSEIFLLTGLTLIVIFGVILVYIVGSQNGDTQLIESSNTIVYQDDTEKIKNTDQEKELGFSQYGLNTNTAKKSIPLKLILNGGPGKDGIPAINEPKFIKISDQSTQAGLEDNTMGILVKVGEEVKFYPYSILYWHEIVNDTIGNKKISVTFCPLCGTAIVYNREINGEERLFGVSGKLYESNLLMYDNKTESLWSQSIGEAVVGDDLGIQLEVLKSDIITFKQFKNKYPEGVLLSENTGFNRSYTQSPYVGYESNDNLYFPVQNSDTRLAKKELLFVLPYNGDSYGFVRSELMKIGELDYMIGDEEINIKYNEGEITVKKSGEELPGYIEMWFSWVTQHPDSQNIWIGGK